MEEHRKISDFRSDTVTRPTDRMRRAMAEAVVGDDVLGDDPTVRELESLGARMVGKEAALYVPSGTMGNTIAVSMWTGGLEEVIVEERSHVYNMESTQMTFISRVTPRPLASRRGAMDPGLIRKNIRKAGVGSPRTSLICVENSHNYWSGAVLPLDDLRGVREAADENGLKVHMDGARIFNASIASGIPAAEYAALTDSIMFCLSKGLSAPVGSLLASDRETIEKARRIRKVLGGGMRQAGILAAAGILALTEMVDRLEEDHRRAKRLADAIAGLPGVVLDPAEIETNIIIFGFEHPGLTMAGLLERLREKDVWALQAGGGVRFVTHKDVDDEDVDRAIEAFREILLRS